MKCSNCGTGCPSHELTGQFCGDTEYELGDRVKCETNKGRVWGSITGVFNRPYYQVTCDDSGEPELFDKDKVSHLLNHELTTGEV